MPAAVGVAAEAATTKLRLRIRRFSTVRIGVLNSLDLNPLQAACLCQKRRIPSKYHSFQILMYMNENSAAPELCESSTPDQISRRKGPWFCSLLLGEISRENFMEDRPISLLMK